VLAGDARIVRAPGKEGVVEHPVGGVAFARRPACRVLEPAAHRAEHGAEEAHHVGRTGEEEALALGLRLGLGLGRSGSGSGRRRLRTRLPRSARLGRLARKVEQRGIDLLLEAAHRDP
jgi:hypothetical protein